jgi:hypothetical protein
MVGWIIEMQGKGYWLHPKTARQWQVNNHAEWVLENPHFFYSSEFLSNLNSVKDIDEIRLFAINQGFVRVRDYVNKISVQFSASSSELNIFLWFIFQFLEKISHKDTKLVLGNFFVRDEIEITQRELGECLRNDEVIFRTLQS